MSIEYWQGTNAGYVYRRAINRIIIKMRESEDDKEPILCARMKHIDILEKALDDFLNSYKLESNSKKNIRARQIKREENKRL